MLGSMKRVQEPITIDLQSILLYIPEFFFRESLRGCEVNKNLRVRFIDFAFKTLKS